MGFGGEKSHLFSQKVAANACGTVSAEVKLLVLMGIGEKSGILVDGTDFWMARIFVDGTDFEAIVAAVLERGGQVRARVIANRRKKSLHSLVKDNVKPGSALFSDALKSYNGLEKTFKHQVIDHAEA